jgi:hypothetical protein
MNFDLTYTEDDQRNDYLDLASTNSLDWKKHKEYPEWLLDDVEIIKEIYCNSDIISFAYDYGLNLLLNYCTDRVKNDIDIVAGFIAVCFNDCKIGTGNNMFKKGSVESLILDDIIRGIKRMHGNNPKFFTKVLSIYPSSVGHRCTEFLEIFGDSTIQKDLGLAIELLKVLEKGDRNDPAGDWNELDWLEPVFRNNNLSMEDYANMVDAFWISYFIFPDNVKNNKTTKGHVLKYLPRIKDCTEMGDDYFSYLQKNNEEFYADMNELISK